MRTTSVEGAMRYLSCGRTRLYELIGEGQIEARKCGRRTIVEVASLDRYLDNAPLITARRAA